MDQVTISRELLRRAEELLSSLITYDWHNKPKEDIDKEGYECAEAIRAALEQPAVDQPRGEWQGYTWNPYTAPQAQQPAPVRREAVSVFGVKSNGEVVDTGVKAPMPPRMKAKELVRETFGTWVDDDGSEADFCFAVCEQFFEWLIAQGWTAQQPAPVQEKQND